MNYIKEKSPYLRAFSNGSEVDVFALAEIENKTIGVLLCSNNCGLVDAMICEMF